MKKFVEKFLKYLLKTILVLCIVFLLFLGSLFVREQKVPGFIVDYLTSKCSAGTLIVNCGGAYFSFRDGLRLRDISLEDVEGGPALRKTVASAKEVHYDFLEKKLIIDRLEYRRLPDSYYLPIDPEVPSSLVEFDVPRIDGMTVVLFSPSILGLTPDKVTFNLKTVPEEKKLLANNAEVVLPGRDCDTIVFGSVVADLGSQMLNAKMVGAATQRQIRPLIETLDIQCALEYMDAFTDVSGAVGAECEIEADLFTLDFSMILDLDVPRMGKYNSVPMAFAKGGIQFRSKVMEGRRYVATKVYLSSSEDYSGSALAGWLLVDDFSGRFKIDYDVRSELKLNDAFRIADFMDPAHLDFIRFDSNSLVTVKGTSGTSSEDARLNDLAGAFESRSGSFKGFSFVDLAGGYSLKDDVVSVNAAMGGRSGGKIEFKSSIFCEKFEDDRSHFAVKGSYRDGSLKELADALSFDLGERMGNVSIDLDISGAVSTNIWRTVNGKGSVKITEGHLARMKLFSGLTGLMAERVPGVSFLVDQTQASCDFTFDNGVFSTKNLYIEGGVVSIKGWGSYDIQNDDLNFRVRVQFLKNESIAGRILHPLTYPITKFLLEFMVTGPLDDPKWEYIQITDRIF